MTQQIDFQIHRQIIENTDANTHIYANIYNSVIHNNPKVEKPKWPSADND